MATWIVHLRIADAILKQHGWLEPANFLVGSIAPDSGIPDASWQHFDPPYTKTHYCEEKLFSTSRDLEFHRQYLSRLEGEQQKEIQSFRWGYFAHLVTDNLWNDVRRAAFTRFREQFPTEERFLSEIKADWYGLDLFFLHEHPRVGFWKRFLTCAYREDAVDLLPAEALNMRVEYIREFYQRTDNKIVVMRSRPFIYLSKQSMDEFIGKSAEFLICRTRELRSNPPVFSQPDSICQPEQ